MGSAPDCSVAVAAVHRSPLILIRGEDAGSVIAILSEEFYPCSIPTELLGDGGHMAALELGDSQFVLTGHTATIPARDG